MKQLSKRTKERIFAVTTITAALLVGVVICEIMSRVLAPPWLEQRMSVLNPHSAGKGFGTDRHWKIVRHNGLFVSFEPNAQFDVSHIEYRTLANIDELGGRKVPVSFTPRGEILPMLGDSFTFGIGLNDNETFASKIAARLPNNRVVNLGIPGSALARQITVIKLRHAELGRPRKYVSFFFIGNDFKDLIGADEIASAARANPEPSFTSSHRILHTVNDFVYRNGLLQRSYLLQLIRRPVLDLYNRLSFSEGATPNREPIFLIMDRELRAYETKAAVALKKQLDALVALEKELSFSVMIVAIPDRNQLDGSARALTAQSYSLPAARLDERRPNRLLARLVGEAGIAFYDSTECLAATNLGDKLYYKQDNHFRAIGAELFARCAAPEVAKFVGKSD